MYASLSPFFLFVLLVFPKKLLFLFVFYDKQRVIVKLLELLFVILGIF